MSAPGNAAKLGTTHSNIQTAQSSLFLFGIEPTIHYSPLYTQFSLDPDVIFSSHTMFINASTKEFTLVNNVIPSYDIAFEELLYYRLAPPIL